MYLVYSIFMGCVCTAVKGTAVKSSVRVRVCVVEIPGPRRPAAYVIPVVTPGLGRCLLWSGLGCLLAPCSPEYFPEL